MHVPVATPTHFCANDVVRQKAGAEQQLLWNIVRADVYSSAEAAFVS